MLISQTVLCSNTRSALAVWLSFLQTTASCHLGCWGHPDSVQVGNCSFRNYTGKQKGMHTYLHILSFHLLVFSCPGLLWEYLPHLLSYIIAIVKKSCQNSPFLHFKHSKNCKRTAKHYMIWKNKFLIWIWEKKWATRSSCLDSIVSRLTLCIPLVYQGWNSLKRGIGAFQREILYQQKHLW